MKKIPFIISFEPEILSLIEYKLNKNTGLKLTNIMAKCLAIYRIFGT